MLEKFQRSSEHYPKTTFRHGSPDGPCRDEVEQHRGDVRGGELHHPVLPQQALHQQDLHPHANLPLRRPVWTDQDCHGDGWDCGPGL